MQRTVTSLSTFSLLWNWFRTRPRTIFLRVRQHNWLERFQQSVILPSAPQVCINVVSVRSDPVSCRVVPQYSLKVTQLPKAKVRENHSFSAVIQGRNLILPSIDEPPPLRIFRGLPRGRSGIVDYVHPFVLFEPHRNVHCLDNAFYVGSRTPWNWSHWLVNFLPSVFAVSQGSSDWLKVPLLLPNAMGNTGTFSEVLSLIWGERPILMMQEDIDYSVKELFWVDAPAYDGPFGVSRAGQSSIFLNHTLFRNFANHITQRLELSQRLEASKRYFFLRPKGFSRISNQSELLRVAENFGFQGVTLAGLPFREQVKIFCSAKHIIAVDGSDLAGLVFAAENVKVVALMSDTRDSHHYYLNYYPNLAAVRHGSLTQLPSREAYRRESDGTFSYDANELRSMLGKLKL